MSSTPATDGAVHLREVSKTFGHGDQAVTAVSQVDLTIERGQFVAIVGPSGCGKSTLLHMVAGLTFPSTGEVVVDGHPVAGPNTDLGVVFQDAELLPWRTALQNVLLQSEIRKMDTTAAKRRALELLERVGLAGFEYSYPDELSGGMQQRVSLTRALLHDPSLLIMDEPFGALDALTRDQIQVDIQQLFLDADKTVILVTHDIEEAITLADRVIVMSPRPSTIASDVRIDLARPRRGADRGSARFQEYIRTLRGEFTRLGVLHEE